MAGPTAWVELTGNDGGWQEGIPAIDYDASTDYFVDVLFEGTNIFATIQPTWTELTGSTPAGTELSVSAAPWVELTL